MKKWIVGSSVTVVAGLIVLYFATAPSDEELIDQAIKDSVIASKEGKPGGVLDHLSRSLTFNGMPVSDRSEIAKYVRLARPDVVFGPYTPVVEGDSATVRADVAVKIQFQSLQMDQTVRGVEVELARETGFRWVVFPASKWRIASVSAPEMGTIGTEFP